MNGWPSPPAALVVASLLVAGIAGAVEHVDNPAEPPARETWTLTERWRVGAAEEDVLLGQVGVLLAGPDGEVYALDTQLAEVQVFGPDGEHRRTLGRQGEGPGEFRQPTGLFWTADGRLAVQQAFPSRIVYLDPRDGTPRGSWSLTGGDPDAGGFAMLRDAGQRGGTFAVSAARPGFDPETREMRESSYLAVIGDDGQEAARLVERSAVRSLVAFTVDELANHFPGERGRWDIAPDGSVHLVPRYDAYLIQVYDPAGRLLREIARPHDARLRTEAEKEEQRDSMSINVNGMEPEITWKLQDRARAVDRMQILDDGTLWVRDSHGHDDWAEHGRQTWAVFSPAGRLLREVTIQTPDAGAGDRLVLLDDGRVMVIKGLESLSVSVSVSDDDETIASEEPLGDVLLELVAYDVRP